MKKMFAVFKREYLQAVRKKMFIIMTFLLPALVALLFSLPGLMLSRMGEKHVAVLDGTGVLGDTLTGVEKEAGDSKRGRDLPQSMSVQYVDARNGISEQPYLDRLTKDKGSDKLDAVFVVPADALSSPKAKLKFYSRSATDIITQERLASRVNRAVQQRRLAQRGMNAGEIDSVLTSLDVDSVQISKSGEQKKGGGANFIAGFILTGLLLMPSFIYGLEIMRGIIQEKTDRVVEVLVSSMPPSQLLIGKILGVAAVGITQVSVWFAMAGIAAGYLGTVSALAGENILGLLRPMTFVYFLIFFILAYMTYVCVYAIGGAVCNSEKEAQQLIAPITMLMMAPWFLLVGIITNPDSSLAVGFSLAPVWGPLTMYVRTLVAEPPLWHIVVSVLVSLATIVTFLWITTKIFRVGILSYGKRPTIPELWRWIKVA
jgi:ABC-2 type transport system permease protein